MRELILTGAFSFFVHGLLLAGANSLCGDRAQPLRCAAAALVGGFYAAGCLCRGFAFLGRPWWRVTLLLVMGMLAFDLCVGAVRKTLVFLLLALALDGITGGSLPKILPGAVLIWVLSTANLRRKDCVRITVKHCGRTLELLALRDTGNGLRDPVSGEAVLILGADAAKNLVDLDRKELQDPVDTFTKKRLPGMRLLPYRTVGQGNGMLLGMRLEEVRINGRPGGNLVAFAPEGLDREGKFQALAGGMA